MTKASGTPIIDAVSHQVIDQGQSPLPPPAWTTLLAALGLFLLLSFAPLAFGSVEPWAILAIQTGASILFLVSLPGLPFSLQESHWQDSMAAPAFGIFLIGCLQALFGTSFYKHATALELRLVLAYGLVFVVARTVGTHRQARRWLHQGFVAFGFLMAVQAILQAFAGNGKMLWLREVHGGAWFFGSYANHSHFAGLMELLIPLALVPVFSRAYERQQRFAASFAATLMIAALLMARSIGGVIALGVQLAIILFIAGKKRWASTANAGLFLGVAGVLAFILILDGGKSLARILEFRDPLHQTDVISRLQIARDSVHLWAQRPVFGWGLGTFQYAFPRAQSFYSQFYVDHAHNDYLELIAETGILGVGCLIWFLVRFVRTGLGIGPSWKDSRSRCIRLACIIGCTGLLVHGLSDFNLHIPANALLFFGLLGLAEARSGDRMITEEPLPE